MLSHEPVWAAIDALAERYSLSASGLAKRAGLDSTAFNQSKRLSADGRPRWPSTESIAKILAATGSSLDEFVALLDGSAQRRATAGCRRSGRPCRCSASRRPAPAASSTMPAFRPARAGTWSNLPAQSRRRRLCAAGAGRFHAAALPRRRRAHRRSRPRPGRSAATASWSRPTTGEVMAKILKRRTAKEIELASLNPDHPDAQSSRPTIWNGSPASSGRASRRHAWRDAPGGRSLPLRRWSRHGLAVAVCRSPSSA